MRVRPSQLFVIKTYATKRILEPSPNAIPPKFALRDSRSYIRTTKAAPKKVRTVAKTVLTPAFSLKKTILNIVTKTGYVKNNIAATVGVARSTE